PVLARVGDPPEPPARSSVTGPWPPVEPNPPSPRAEPGSVWTSWNCGQATRWTTSWAIRSPRSNRTGSAWSVLSRVTLISPRVPATGLAACWYAVTQVTLPRPRHCSRPIPAVCLAGAPAEQIGNGTEQRGRHRRGRATSVGPSCPHVTNYRGLMRVYHERLRVP